MGVPTQYYYGKRADMFEADAQRALVNGEKDGKDYQSVNYTGLIGLLVKEVQDLKQEVHHLKSRVTILETPK